MGKLPTCCGLVGETVNYLDISPKYPNISKAMARAYKPLHVNKVAALESTGMLVPNHT